MHNPTPFNSPQIVLALPSPLFQPASANEASVGKLASTRKMVSHGRVGRPKSFGSQLLIRAGIGGPHGKKGKTIVEEIPGATNNIGFRVGTECKRDESKSRAPEGVSNAMQQGVHVCNQHTPKKPMEVLDDLLGEVQRDAKKRRTTPSKSKSEVLKSQPPTHGTTVLEKQIEASKNPQSHRGSEPFRPPKASPVEIRSRNANGRQVKLLNRLTLILQESSAFLQKHVEAEGFIGLYPELKSFRNAARRLLDEVDQGICLLREKEMQKLEAEKTCFQSAAAAEQVKLLKEVEILEREVASVKAVCSKLESDIARFTRLSTKDKSDPEVTKNPATDNSEAETSQREQVLNELNKSEEGSHEDIRLGRKVSKLPGKGSCLQCHSNPPDALVLPCLHLQYCSPCLERLKTLSEACPVKDCRKKITAVVNCLLE